MRFIIAILCTMFLCSCGGPNLLPFESLFSRQPRVVSVEPADGSTIEPNAIVALEFSEPIDPLSVDLKTLAIVKEEENSDEGEDVVQSVIDGKKEGIEGVYEFGGEGRVAVFRAKEPYESGARYKVIATGQIMSVEMIPLSQRPGSAQSAFVSEFVVGGEGGTSSDGSGSGSASGESSEGGESGSASGESSEGGGSGSASGESSEGGAAKDRPSMLVINEILYDIPGDDTDGKVFIELYGDAGGDIGDYKILLVNGEDGKTNETIEIPGGAKIPDDGIFLIADSRTGQSGVSQVAGADLVDNFDPQNGPDCVEILDDHGALLDALGYGTPIVAQAQNGLACFEGTLAPKASSGKGLTRTGGADMDDNAADFHAAAPTPGVL